MKMFKKLKNSDDSFVIAEVGQNHQGEIDLALEYIDVFARAGADAIKFQKRDNKYLFSSEKYASKYNSSNAFAPTYGAHREALELSYDDFSKLKTRCKKNNVKFMCTAFDEPSLDMLVDLDVDILKVASFDLGNLSFLNRIASTKKPVVISVGGGKTKHIDATIQFFQNFNLDLAILHCVSEYPCDPESLGLNNIEKMIERYPDHLIGLSDHFSGTLSGPLGFMCGARIFEKHVTLNRAWKGTDHAFALEEKGFKSFVRDIKRAPKMLPPKQQDNIGTEYVFTKLGKSICAKTDLSANEYIDLNNIIGKISEQNIIPVRETYSIIGKKLNRNVKAGEPIYFEYFD
jgi:sialic acid synthase